MKRGLIVLASLGSCAGAQADIITGFESPPYNASAAGTILTGQASGVWTQPIGGAADQRVFTYSGNQLGLSNNPNGGQQFMGMRTGTGGQNAVAQHDHNFSGTSEWIITYDVAVNWQGTGPAANSIGTFALAPPPPGSVASHRTYTAANDWVDPNNPSMGWRVSFQVFDAIGSPMSPQAAFASFGPLQESRWYRLECQIDFSANRITAISIEDLLTGAQSSAAPMNWYLGGGLSNALPLPTAVRFRELGATGNAVGWDNVSITAVPGPGPMALVVGGLLLAARRSRRW